jgi:hypothetical protein
VNVLLLLRVLGVPPQTHVFPLMTLPLPALLQILSKTSVVQAALLLVPVRLVLLRLGAVGVPTKMHVFLVAITTLAKLAIHSTMHPVPALQNPRLVA